MKLVRQIVGHSSGAVRDHLMLAPSRRGAGPATERARFVDAIGESSIRGRELFASGVTFSTWSALFNQLAAALPDDSPSVVVIDELPWLIESDASLEGTLQTVWDTRLAHKPVLVVLNGSDLAMMERLDDYERPFHQRVRWRKH